MRGGEGREGERFLRRGGEIKHNLLCSQNYPHSVSF
jgi:hypothetical protein